MVAGTGIHRHFSESTAVGDVNFQLCKVSIELWDTAGGLKNSDDVL